VEVRAFSHSRSIVRTEWPETWLISATTVLR
jgi:hypothetical protein